MQPPHNSPDDKAHDDDEGDDEKRGHFLFLFCMVI
jgi:hypothetical protein